MPVKFTETIKMWSVKEEYAELGDDIRQAMSEVLASGQLILGERVAAFEQAFATYCNTRFGIGVNSGTDAIFLALKALGIGNGDEVITVSYTAVPTVSAICATSAKPVFVDIDEDTCVMDPMRVEAAVTEKTKALLPVHLYGHAVDMNPLLALARSRRLAVIEDCAQSHGCRYHGAMTGSLGTIGAFSFYPTKVLGAYGDAGMCVTASEELAQRLRELRMYGMKEAYYSNREGYNSRLDEAQAAILQVKLRRLDEFLARRQAIARRYDEALQGLVRIPDVKPYSTHSYYLYVVRHPDRDAIVKALKGRGIEVGVHFPWPIHLMSGYQFLGYQRGDFPIAEGAAREVLSLPIYPQLSEASVDAVIAALRDILR